VEKGQDKQNALNGMKNFLPQGSGDSAEFREEHVRAAGAEASDLGVV